MILETAEIEKIKLHSFTGGNLRNAIPREAFTEISISKNHKDQIFSTLLKSFQNIKSEFGSKEPNINFECVEIQNSSTYILESEWILNTIIACPHGTISLSADIKDLVETSTNLAIVKTLNTNENTGMVKIECFMRSSSDSALVALANTHKSFFALANFRGEFGNSYSGWKPNMNSAILKIASTIFFEMNKLAPSVKAIHAGLETGYFTKHFPDMDMVSIGPTIKHPHSPDEKVSIPSVANFWEYLTKIISRFE
jgi:dipeptidase D